MNRCWASWTGANLQLLVHVQPGASKSGVAGLHGGRLKLRVSAAPTEGKANAAVCRWLGSEFGVPATRVSLVSGHGSRSKVIVIAGPVSRPEWFERLTRATAVHQDQTG